jgi:protein-disulfide isomerase
VPQLFTRTELERAARLALREANAPEDDLAVHAAVEAIADQQRARYYGRAELLFVALRAAELARACPDDPLKIAALAVMELAQHATHA